MSHLYIMLPFDSTANYYPDNTIAHFVTKLPERICLEGEYEVDSAEIIYLHTWYNGYNGDKNYWIAVIEVDRNRMQTEMSRRGITTADPTSLHCWIASIPGPCRISKPRFRTAKSSIDVVYQFKRKIRISLECPTTCSVTWVPN
jgi:hypothetical protein